MTLCALLLGRLQVGLTRGAPGALRILANRLVRESLIAALRREGHEFTDDRFFAWFSGLQPLTDYSEANLRPPKAICQAILTELAHSPWADLSAAAEALRRGFLAPSDFGTGQDNEEAHLIIAQAYEVVAAIEPGTDALPFRAIRQLFAAAAKSPRFARAERSIRLVAGKAVEQVQPGNAAWALDLLCGSLLAPRHGLPIPLPLPGLVILPERRFDPFRLETEQQAIPEEAILAATHNAFAHLNRWLDEAECDCASIANRLTGRRSSGRASHLAEFLAGFGPMSGAQVGNSLGATRAGADIIASTLEQNGLLTKASRPHAVRMFQYTPSPPASLTEPIAQPERDAASDAVHEYEASLRELDALLSRSAIRSNGED